MSLAELKIGDKAKITGIDAKGAIRNRLIALGLSDGAHVTLSRHSAASQTFAAQIGASVIALRKEEAATIRVSRL